MVDYLHHVQAIILLDGDGKRIFSKYWLSGMECRSKQKSFEEKLFKKISGRSEATANPGPSTNEESSGTDLKRILNLARPFKKESTSPNENGEVLLFEDHLVVYRSEEDTSLFLVGSSEENEVVLLQVLTSFWDALNQLLRNNCEKKTLLENFELLILVADEMIDDGIILEINPQNIFNEVSPHATLDSETPLNALNTMAKLVKQNL
eukprot:GGOE01003478.1.p1 GENE.GGOE01003478.1~~GGOE01003478.1.p1  ORF type:complete len:207 (-),score=23.62 GGOE01003478.1:276-896(-)